jgi:hypothetical protein
LIAILIVMEFPMIGSFPRKNSGYAERRRGETVDVRSELNQHLGFGTGSAEPASF